MWLCTGDVTSRTTEGGKRIHLLHVFRQLRLIKRPEMESEEMKSEASGGAQWGNTGMLLTLGHFAAEMIQKLQSTHEAIVRVGGSESLFMVVSDRCQVLRCGCVCDCTCLFTHTASACKYVCGGVKWWLGGFQSLASSLQWMRGLIGMFCPNKWTYLLKMSM